MADLLDPESLHGVDLPRATKDRLLAGLPRELRLPGWLGPTLFSSELSAGRLATLHEFGGVPVEHPLASALVVGTVRETDGAPTTYAAWCLRPGSGELWHVDLDAPFVARYANASLDQYLGCVRAYLDARPHIEAVPEEELLAFLCELRDGLLGVDATTFTDGDNYWPLILEGECMEWVFMEPVPAP